MEQHPVPQHIASFEFKLFGNLTVRQFITLAIPMAAAAAVYFSSLPVIVRLPLAAVLGLFGLFAALVPIGGRPFDKWAVAFIKAITSPTQRIWVKESKIPEFLSVVTAPPPTEENIPESITAQGRARLREYLRSLPKGEVTPLDVREQIAVQRLDLGYQEGLPFRVNPQGKLPPPIIWATAPFAQASLPQINVAPKLTTAKIPAGEDYQGQLETSFPTISTTPSASPSAAPKITTHAKPYALPGLEKKLKEEMPIVELSPTKPIVRAQLASEANAAIENIIPIRTGDKQIKLIHGIGKTRVRKLHFAPPIGFDLSKLPIRGEKRFEISEELKRRYGATAALFNEPSPAPVPKRLHLESTPNPITRQPNNLITQNTPHAPRSVPKPAKTTTVPEDVYLKREELPEIDSQIAIHSQKSKDLPLTTTLARAQIIPLTNRPNVISGIVTDSAKTPLENIILVVKDATGIPLRALKTNKLGQFLSATPLANGTYTIDVESELAKFAPFTLNITGQVLSPIGIQAKGGNASG